MKTSYIIALLLVALLVACQPPSVQQTVVTRDDPATGNVVQGTTVVIPEGKGRVVFTLSSTGRHTGVSSLRMTIDNVEAYNAEDGWVTINGDENSYDLLQLQGEHGLLGDKVIDAQSYSQVRMKISSVQLTDASGEHNVRLPMENLIINADLNIAQGSISTVTFDFLIDQGLRTTQSREYVMLPVVHLITRQNAAVDLRPSNRVIITSGTILSDVTFGTNVRGETGVDVRVPTTTIIVVENERIIERTTIVDNTIIENNTTIRNNTIINNNMIVENNINAANTTPSPTKPKNTTSSVNGSANTSVNSTA